MSAGTAVHRGFRMASAPARREPAQAARATLAAVAALTVLAAVLRFARLAHQGFWFDEANTALLVHFSPGKMLGLLPGYESTPPLYYCVAWVWARVFGYGEAGLRSLSALTGVATVPVAYLAAAKLASRRAGLIAAALTATSPLLVWYSQEARSYEMLVLLSGLALAALAYALEAPTPRRVAIWVAASALALATHYYAILAIVPQAAWLLAVHRRRRPAQVAVSVVGVCGLALIPLALSQNGNGRGNWISHYPLVRRLAEVPAQLVVGFGAPAYHVLEAVALAAAAVGLVLLLTGSERRERRGGLAAGALAVAGAVLMLIMVAGGVDDLITRNLLALWVPAAVAVSVGLAAARPRLLGPAAAAALCATGIVAAVGVAVNRNLERPDWRVVARAVGARPAGDAPARALLVQHYRDLLPMSLYLPGLHWMKGAGATVSELDVVSFTDPPTGGFCWWGSACNLWPSTMQARYSIPGFHEAWRRHELQFTVLRLVSPRPVRLSPREVSRALHTTALPHDELLVQGR